MTTRRMAHAGLFGSAIASLALLTMGSGSQPKFGDPLQGAHPRSSGPVQGRKGSVYVARGFRPVA